MRKYVTWFCAICLIGFCLPSFSTGKPAVSRPHFFLGQPDKSQGEYVISVHKEGEWKEAGRLSFNQFPAEKFIDLGVGLPSDESPRIRIVQQGGGAAHIDFVSLGGNPPTHVKGSTDPGAVKKVAQKDHDLMDAFGKSLELAFPAIGKDRALRLVARVEGREISKIPFQFPRENLHREMTEKSRFYRYDVSPETANITSKPFFEEFSGTGSGHPSGFTYGWVGHDAENLYVTLDFTPDNTMDGDKDYAKVYVKTDTGLREFKSSMSEIRWGRPNFRYTDKVLYQHKVYEFKIPLKEMNVDDILQKKVLQLAFAAYGTASPGDYRPAAAYDPQNNRYVVVYEKAQASYYYDIYGQLIGLDGAPVGSEFLISGAGYDQREPSIARGSDGKFLVVWSDNRDGFFSHIYGQIVNPDGTLHNSNFIVSDMNANKYFPAIANNPSSSRHLVVWQDYRGDTDIYGQLVNETGTLYGTASDVNFAISDAAQAQYYPSVAFDSVSDRFLVAWNDYRSSSTYDIYGQLVDVEGTLYGTDSDVNFVISNATGDQYRPVGAYDEVNGRFLVVWEDYRSPSDAGVYGQLVNANGTLYGTASGENFVISDLTNNQMYPSMVRDGCNGGFVLAWTDYRSGTTLDIYGQLVHEDGTLNGSDFVINESAGHENYSSLASNGNCGALVAFETWVSGVPVIGLSILGGLPDIFLSTYSHDFGDVDVGSSATQEITISNVGTADLRVAGVSLLGGDAGMFSFVSGGASPCPDFPATIAPDSDCTLEVTFTPASGGIKSTNLVISSNDFDEPNDAIELTGNGLAPYTKVTVLAPNGGEPFKTGDITTIEWGAPATAIKFKLFYSVDNGVTWVKVTPDFVFEKSYPWTVPILTANRKSCRVKVVGYRNNGVLVGSDKSDTPFSIEVIKLTSPDGGNTLYSGVTEIVTWRVNATKSEVASIKLSYTKNNGITWLPIETLKQETTGAPKSLTVPDWPPVEYGWLVPDVPGEKTKCKVKIVLKSATGVTLGSDVSEAVFTISNDR